MNTLTYVTLIAGAASSLALVANAATMTIDLINEDFNDPAAGAVSGDSLVGDTTNFPAWNFNDSSAQYKVGPGDGVPVSAGDGYVKIDTFESFGNPYTIAYDTGRNWLSTDTFTLSLNATEQSWNSAGNRFMVVSIIETSRSGNQLDGAVLWTQTEELVLDPNHDEGGEGWGPSNTFSWTFAAADFTNGTEGNPISFEIKGTGDRGYFFDNVLLSADVHYNPPGTVLVIQ